MGVAAVVGIAQVVDLVATYAPQLITDVTSLASLYSNASTAVANSAPDGTVAAADWAALQQTEAALRAELDTEVSRAEAAVSGTIPPTTTSGGGSGAV